jgi:hypothetical protein
LLTGGEQRAPPESAGMVERVFAIRVETPPDAVNSSRTDRQQEKSRPEGRLDALERT